MDGPRLRQALMQNIISLLEMDWLFLELCAFFCFKVVGDQFAKLFYNKS